MVGWSIATPTLIGVAAGIWVDNHWPGPFSWTLMLMVGGLLLGCWNAWYWVSVEQRAIREDDDEGIQEDGDD